MLNKTLDYLITTVGFSQEKIISLIEKSNIEGHVIVGNQKCNQNSESHFKVGCCDVDLFNLTSRGVSISRNFLLSKTKADYVMFLDDDSSFADGYLKEIEYEFLKEHSFNISIRFNVVSLNKSRPIRQINKSKKVSLYNLRQYGVWGIIFNRGFLLKNNLAFREYIGPGTNINHGEDYIFLSDYYKKGGKIWQNKAAIMSAEQEESTWQGKNRNLKNELFAHGHNYRILYKNKASILLLFHMLKHLKFYSSKDCSFFKAYRFGLSGIKFRKEIEKGLKKYE